MNRRALRDLLDVEGVGRDAYRLDATGAEQALSLGPVEGGWRVWFTERGQPVTTATFETEDEACDDMVARLLSDNSNRWVLVAGPSDADSADRDLQRWLIRFGVPREELKPVDLRTEDLQWTATEMRRRHWISRTATRRLPVTLLSDDILRQVKGFEEFRMGVHRVGVRLADGRAVPDVFVAGKRVSWVAAHDTIPFRSDEVVAAFDLRTEMT